MKTALFVASLVLLASTLICGLWIKFSGKADSSSTDFHMWLAIITILVVAVTLFVRR
jgi:hypothetical protein